jgi:2-polyprenyl-3-methyl-5-hydroxy-6-metoxy-1,4-benzoquinol methylase
MASKTDHVQGDGGYLLPPAQRGLFGLPRRREFLLGHAHPPPKRVLDVGCAGGYIALMLSELGHEVLGVELNERMAAEARARGVDVLEHDLDLPLPLPDDEFDLVHACEVVEHLFDTEGFLRELRRVLRPGGALIASTPNLNSLHNRVRVLLGRPVPMWGAYPGDLHGGHIRVFNRAKLVELLERCGFEVTEIIGSNQNRLAPVLDRLPTFSELLLVRAVKRS